MIVLTQFKKHFIVVLRANRAMEVSEIEMQIQGLGTFVLNTRCLPVMIEENRYSFSK